MLSIRFWITRRIILNLVLCYCGNEKVDIPVEVGVYYSRQMVTRMYLSSLADILGREISIFAPVGNSNYTQT